MNRIDFHSIATILLSYLIDADYSQMDFIYMLKCASAYFAGYRASFALCTHNVQQRLFSTTGGLPLHLLTPLLKM